MTDMMKHPPAPLLSLLLGAIAALGFAPLDLWPLTLAGFAAWIALVHAAPTARAALWRGWLFGLGHFTVNDNWIAHAFQFQENMPAALGWFAPVALALYLAVYPMAAAWLAWRFAKGTRLDAAYILAFAAAWIATEWLRATLFTGYAWNPLGVVWVPVQPVAGIAAYIGTYALSGLTVALAGFLLLIPHKPRPVAAATAALAMLLAVQAFSYVRIEQTSPNQARIEPRLRVVQPDIGQDQRGQTDGERMFRTLAALSGKPGPAPRLLLWPEGVVREYIEDGYPDWLYDLPPRLARRRLAALLGPDDLLLAGGTALQFDRHEEPTSATNSVFAVTPRANIVGRYDKAHLVPYGEYLPMRPLLSAIGLSRLVPGDIDFHDGPGPLSYRTPHFGKVGMQICYEIIFSGDVVDEKNRPDLLFNPSNDAWFGAWGPPQHLAQARMRAIEEGILIVRATPTGISAVIAADGTLLATQPLGTRGAIEVPLPRPLPPTLFARVGNWMALAAAILLAFAAIAVRRRTR